MRNDARCGLLVHDTHTRFSAAEQAVDSNAPSVHVVQGMQVATVIWPTAMEKLPVGHRVGAIDALGQYPQMHIVCRSLA